MIYSRCSTETSNVYFTRGLEIDGNKHQENTSADVNGVRYMLWASNCTITFPMQPKKSVQCWPIWKLRSFLSAGHWGALNLFTWSAATETDKNIVNGMFELTNKDAKLRIINLSNTKAKHGCGSGAEPEPVVHLTRACTVILGSV